MAEETFVHTLAGRTMTFLKADQGRLLLLQRVIKTLEQDLQRAIAQEDNDLTTQVIQEISDLTWTTIEAQFTDPADLAYVRKAILGLKLKEQDLYALLANGAKTSPEDDADPVPPRRAAKVTKAAPKKRAR